ncbi:MAG: L,D-transpeptidase, partial [Polyangiaceae bacterium]|nr:L,D-transpeptidase [Polyangiaceae bacterium]
AWLKATDVRRPSLAAPPPEVDVAAGERWIDVDLATQTLVAYEGPKPVFTTLVSTGKGRPGSVTVTPKGVFRVWIKLLSSDMDNLEDENAARYYRMETVPYVQYFSKGVGLHGAFWHRGFGQVRSHGCVNLAPLDAQRLFAWTSPRLPAGWTAVVPTAHEPGTVIRVR